MAPVLRSAGYEPDEFREMMTEMALEPGHALIGHISDGSRPAPVRYNSASRPNDGLHPGNVGLERAGT